MTRNLNDAANAAVSKFFSIPGSPLTSLSSEEQNDGTILELPLSEIADYHNHTFKVSRKPEEEWNALVKSIHDYGVQQPILVRRTPGKEKPYECISGHRRRLASKDAGKTTIPAKVTELDDDHADLLMVLTNTCQRTTWLPSEKAKSWKAEYDALKHQGVKDSEADKLIEEITGQSLRTVQRYIRLNNLSDSLLDALDGKKLSFNAAYLASGLDEEKQSIVLRLIQNDIKVTANSIEEIANEPDSTFESVLQKLEKPPERPSMLSFKKKDIDAINACFPDDFEGSAEDKLLLIEVLLKEHFHKL